MLELLLPCCLVVETNAHLLLNVNEKPHSQVANMREASLSQNRSEEPQIKENGELNCAPLPLTFLAPNPPPLGILCDLRSTSFFLSLKHLSSELLYIFH